MSTAEIQDFRLNNENFEVVDNFDFLGSKIDISGGCEKEITKRIAMGKTAMNNLTKIMKDNDISIKTKTRIVQTMVFPVMMYGCEGWTIRVSERRKIDAFEMWCWRRLLRIPWTAKRTNKYVLDTIKPGVSLKSKIL